MNNGWIQISLFLTLLAVASQTPPAAAQTRQPSGQLAAAPQGPVPFTCHSSGKCYCSTGKEGDCNKMKAKVCEPGKEPQSVGGGTKSCDWKNHARQSPGFAVRQPASRQPVNRRLTAAGGGRQPYACTSDGWKCFCWGTEDCKKLADSGECLDDVNDGSCNWQEGD